MLTYRDALRVMLQRTDYERQEQPPYAERVWRLERMAELADALGNPHLRYPSLHVAGTKGKGSTTAMLEAMLRAHGYRTGMFTSPHLHTFRERVRLDGEPITEERLAELVTRLEPYLAARPEVTVFEGITALAMLAFAEAEVDVAVFEVGLGGRLDSTNILTPLVSVITSISLDHLNVLGGTLEAIAREKAGIIKPGVPVVSAPQSIEAGAVICQVAEERQAPLTVVGRDWHWRPQGVGGDGQRLAVMWRGHWESPEHADLHLPLLGAFQLENAATAIATLEVLAQEHERDPRAQPLALDRRHMARGLATVKWPGRLEVLGRAPLVVVDGAHNAYSIQRLLEALRGQLPHRRLLAVFGAGASHTPQEMLRRLHAAQARLILTRSRHAKATPLPQLRELAATAGIVAAEAADVAAALDLALAEAATEDLVLVTGSLFVVAEAREAWAARRGLPLPPSDPPGAYG